MADIDPQVPISFPKPTKAWIIAAAFGKNDNEILLGHDDCVITCTNPATARVDWSFHVENPEKIDHNLHAMFESSPDVTRVAVASPGSVYGTMGDHPV